MPQYGNDRNDVPAAWADALEQVVAVMRLTGPVAEFVLTGQPAGAPQNAVPPNRRLSRAGLHWRSDPRPAVAAFYAGFGDIDAVVLRRWGVVLDATVNPTLGLGDLAGHRWHEVMLLQAAAGVPSGPLPLTFADLERIAAQDGIPAVELVRMAFTLSQYYYTSKDLRGCLTRLPGFADTVAAHPEVASAALAAGRVEQRLHAVALLGELADQVPGALTGLFVEAATTTSAQVRGPARAMLDRIGDAAVEPLRAMAANGTASQRAHALDLLAARPDQRAWARAAANSDRVPRVQALLTRWDAEDAAVAAEAEEGLLPELPPLPPWSLPAADAERVAEHVYEALQRAIEPYSDRPDHESLKPSHSMVAHLAELLAADLPVQVGTRLSGLPTNRGRLIGSAHGTIADVFRQHEYSAATAIQVVTALGLIDSSRARGVAWHMPMVEVHARTGGPDMLTMQRMIDAVGAEGRAWVWEAYRLTRSDHRRHDWPDEQVRPFVVHNLDWLLEQNSPGLPWLNAGDPFFEALATLPQVPAKVTEHLYAAAFGARKTDRDPAQAALARDPQRTSRAAAALQDGKADIRLAAAQWLTRIADPAARPALRAAWKKEKQDVVRGALLDALVAAGEDAGTYLDPAQTLADAERFVAKGLPSSIAWLDWDTVPSLTWASSGEPVPRAVVQWLCGTAVQAKSPEPNVMLRQYAALFDPVDRERLAAHLLTAWIAEDLAGSAIASKGLLAVVAACGGRDVASPAERFLREWAGPRFAQCKELLAMLAWTEHPSATQVVMAVGMRSRTASLQDEALRHTAALAARKGWTVDELADRSIPAAGFSDDAVLELPYGARTFTAALSPDLTVELRDPDGKAIKALPTPRQSDDADQAKEAKKALTAVRKDLKAITAQQTQRLYEAMCTQRSWAAEDWDRYLLRHPIVGTAVRRLVWVATSEEGDAVTFRPLDDGALTDADDNDVQLPAGARITLAHDSVLPDGQAERWTRHLADYEITPLFQQLGRSVHAITPELQSQREITDFTGHMIESNVLHAKADKLGYTRGPTDAFNWFDSYVRYLPSLGITVTVNFSGNAHVESHHQKRSVVALKELTFGGLTLGDVPAALVSECWADMREIAAAGSGFNPDWKTITRR